MKNSRISIWKLFFYFIIYSFLGYIIETIYGIITMGVFQSRQSFLYGPFCGIYGIAAVFIIFFSKYFNKNTFTLFLGGCLIGSATEYIISFLLEVFLDTNWWNYSNYFLNINGRICLLYTAFWGALTVFLIRYLNPLIEKICKKIFQKIPYRIIKRIILIIIIFITFDCFLTCYAQDVFITKVVIENNIETKDIKRRKEYYKKLQTNSYLKKFNEKFFNDTKMIKTFPNIKIKDKDNNIVYIDSFLQDIEPYYIKLFEK